MKQSKNNIRPIQVKFENQINPNSTFDLIKLEDIFEREHLDHDPQELHTVEFFIILLITEGTGIHTIDFTNYKYKKGTLLTIRKDQIQSFTQPNHSKGYLLLFTDDFLISYLEKLESQKTLQLFNELLGEPKLQLSNSNYNVMLQIIDRIQNEYLNKMDTYSLAIIRSELQILITKLYRIKSKSNPVISDKKYLSEFIEFQSLIEECVSQTSQVKDYSAMMGKSTKTLNTIVKHIANKTAKEFIDEIGIKQIKRLLINTSLSIKEIAYQSGFEETTNFYKYFKRHVGKTPEQFRTTH